MNGDMTLPEYHRWMLKRLEALAAATPQESSAILRPMIEHQQEQLQAAERLQEEAGRIGLTLGYRKSATGAMQPHPVVLGSEHRTRTNSRDA